MANTTSETRTTRSTRLDQAGRILVDLGGLVTGPLVVMPLVVFALLTLGLANLFSDPGRTQSQMFAAALMVFVGVVAVTIVMMRRGGTVTLALGGIGGFILGALGLTGLASASQEWAPEILLAFSRPVAAGGFALALGASFRLIAHRTERSGL